MQLSFLAHLFPEPRSRARRALGGSALVVCGLLAMTLPSCGCPGPNDPDGGDGDGGANDCQLVEVGEITLDGQEDFQTVYSAPLTTNIGGGAPDYLVFNFINYNERVGALGAGTFSLSEPPNDNRGPCADCVSIFEDQLTPSSPPATTFFQSAGTLTVEENPRETLALHGSLTGLELVEVEIDMFTLESTPVPGGRCLRVADLELDYRYVPEEWTCDAAEYDSGGTCNCACGAFDPDCFCDPFLDPGCNPDPPDDCPTGSVCTYEGCRVSCDPFSTPPVGCLADELCSFSDEGPVCIAAAGRVNEAMLDGVCVGLGGLVEYCAVTSTVPAGICDDQAGICQALCGPDNPCPEGEGCYTLAVGSMGEGWGYCVDEDDLP